MAAVDLNFGSTPELAEWISETERFEDPVAIERARNAFIDTIACILAAAQQDIVSKVSSSVNQSNGGACSIVGRPQNLAAEEAALVNATAAHALDFDDNFLPAVTHASAVLVPALLALGEELDVMGDRLLDAYIVGLEVQAWLGERMVPAHYAAGWHATSTIGAVGAAAACARLLSINSHKSLNALSLATSMAGGSKQQFGSMTKPLHAGLAARAGVLAARLAKNGIGANQEPFFGQWGFLALHHADPTSSLDAKLELAIVTSGVAQKRFPCCASAHRTLDAVIHLMQKHDISISDISRISTIVPDSNFRNLRFSDPDTENEARFSMTYCVAVAANFGTVRLADFTSDAVKRPSVLQFMHKVDMQSAGAVSDEGEGIWDYPAITNISLISGEDYSHSVLQPMGTIHAPMADTDLFEKFIECAGLVLSAHEASGFLDSLTHFEGQEVRHVAAQIRGLGDLRTDNE